MQRAFDHDGQIHLGKEREGLKQLALKR